MKKSILALTLASATLIGCGGSGGDSTPTPTPAKTIKGKVIDGYIVGARVFLDLNYNSVWNEGEPNRITDESGEFVLDVAVGDADCSQYVPTVTHVPVGAIDLDDPENPIEEAYDMVIPPSFVLSTDADLLNLTPLTTIVWTAVEKELKGFSETPLTCKSIIADQNLREVIKTRLEQQERRVASRYNITVDDLYSDYVADGNTELHGFAKELVPGLKASYEETLVLEAEHPNANYLFVEYFIGRENKVTNVFDQEWYRREFVQASMGNFVETVRLVSSDLSEQYAVVSKRTQRTKNTTAMVYEESISLEANGSWTNDTPAYKCDITEAFLQGGKATAYGVNNMSYVAEASDWNACAGMDKVHNLKYQNLITKTFYPGTDVVKTSSTHYFRNGSSSGMEFLIGFGDDISKLDGSELDALNYISTEFENTDDYGADAWDRYKSYYASTEFWNEDEVTYFHDSDDRYLVNTFYVNGTHTSQCGTWSTGTLTDCTK